MALLDDFLVVGGGSKFAWLAGAQGEVLRYSLPALACAPPLLAQLQVRPGAEATLISVDVTVSPNLPGPLNGLTVDLAVPGTAAPPLRVR